MPTYYDKNKNEPDLQDSALGFPQDQSAGQISQVPDVREYLIKKLQSQNAMPDEIGLELPELRVGSDGEARDNLLEYIQKLAELKRQKEEKLSSIIYQLEREKRAMIELEIRIEYVQSMSNKKVHEKRSSAKYQLLTNQKYQNHAEAEATLRVWKITLQAQIDYVKEMMWTNKEAYIQMLGRDTDD